MGFAELHFHLLPGVDDGPTSLAESVALARAAVVDGTEVLTVTPHVHPEHITDPSEIPALTRELAEHLRREQVPLRILPGGELDYSMVGRLTQDQLQDIAHGPQGRRWLLLESSFEGLGDPFAEAADELRERGFGIVLAHPERSEQTARTRALIEREIDLGSVLQVTAASITGENGPGVRELAAGLLRAAPRTLIASDAHGSHRPPALRAAVEALLAAGERDPRRLAGSVPQALLERGLIRAGTRSPPEVAPRNTRAA